MSDDDGLPRRGFVDVEAAADYLAVRVYQLEDAALRGRGPRVRVYDGRLWYGVEDLRAYKADREGCTLAVDDVVQ